MNSAISNYSAMEVSRDFSTFLPSYYPSNPRDALVSLVKLNGLRLGIREILPPAVTLTASVAVILVFQNIHVS